MNPATIKLTLIAAFYVLSSWFWYHQGGLAPKLAEAKAEIKVDQQQDAKRVTDTKTVAQEAKAYDDAKAADPDPAELPDVRVCYYKAAPNVPSRGPARPGPDAPPALRQGPTQDPGPDIAPAIVHTGNVANAQVAGLQDYINRVCQAH